MSRPLVFALVWALAGWNLLSLLGFAIAPLLTAVSVPGGLAIGAVAHAYAWHRFGGAATAEPARATHSPFAGTSPTT